MSQPGLIIGPRCGSLQCSLRPLTEFQGEGGDKEAGKGIGGE